MTKIVVVKKATTLEELLQRHVTTSQVKFYLQDSYTYFSEQHVAYHRGLEKTLLSFPKTTRIQVIDKAHLPTFTFGEKDIVVSVGDDGLLVNVAKYLDGQSVIAINPDSKRYDGILASCVPDSFPRLLAEVLDEKVSIHELTMAEASLDNGQVMYALNDLFLGRNTHVSARYTITYAGQEERQSSSGIIVSTGTGSTGWLTSVAAAARAFGGNVAVPFPQDAGYLYFVVREPFPSKITGTSIVQGRITKEFPLTLVSHMPEKGVIFSDGMENDYLDFNAGRTATIKPAEKKVRLVKALQQSL